MQQNTTLADKRIARIVQDSIRYVPGRFGYAAYETEKIGINYG